MTKEKVRNWVLEEVIRDLLKEKTPDELIGVIMKIKKGGC